MNGLDVIAPAFVPVDFAGRLVHVTPLKVGQLPAFARAIKPLGAQIEQIAAGRAALDVAGLLDLVAEHGEAIVQAVSIGTGIKVDELNNSTPDVLVELAVVVLKVNADFFKGRLTPAILAAVARVVLLPTPGAGPTA